MSQDNDPLAKVPRLSDRRSFVAKTDILDRLDFLMALAKADRLDYFGYVYCETGNDEGYNGFVHKPPSVDKAKAIGALEILKDRLLRNGG